MAVDTSSDEFVITRVFDAPRDLVWKAWTEPARLRHWWGPKGFKVHHCRVDLRPGGLFHYGMKASDGSDMWGRFVYREIVAPEKLVFIVSFSDKDGGISRHPSSPGWPLEMLSTVLFEEQGGKTRITVKWSPHSANEAERKIFRDGKPSMQQGWSGTFEQFTDYLARQ
jgi:uncharacterized protein YndB with AHSA1/START domain